MKNFNHLEIKRLALACALAFAVSPSAHAQFGGLLKAAKKKAVETVEKKVREEIEPQKNEPATQEAGNNIGNGGTTTEQQPQVTTVRTQQPKTTVTTQASKPAQTNKPAQNSQANKSNSAPTKLWKGGSIFGELRANNEVWIGGSRQGKFDNNGKIWVGSSIEGELLSNGSVRKGGSIVGKIQDRKVWLGGSIVGEIRPNGDIIKGGSIMGRATPLRDLEKIAVIYFFGFWYF